MKIVTILILLLVVGITVLWLYGFIKANDLSVSTKENSELGSIKKVLLIFPHPDDEANSLSGTITQFVNKGIQVDWVILSKGEKGNEDAHYDEKLKATRVKEAYKVARILDVANPIFSDYPDDGMSQFKEKLTADLKAIIKNKNPNLVITYDESGGYGHPDHMIVSKVVTELLAIDFTDIHLWYTSTPQKLFNDLSLPEQMATDKDFKSSRKFPSFKILVVGRGLLNKIKAEYAYQSQFSSFVKAVPVKQIPMWFYVSLTPYEYFYEVK